MMQMRRGDLVTVAAAGDCGKPRPAVIVQMDCTTVIPPDFGAQVDEAGNLLLKLNP